MKRLSIVFVFAVLLVAFACKKTSNNTTYTISGEINVESGVIYLQDFHNKMFAIVDSAVIENGKFTFTGSLARPDLFGLTLEREETFSPYFIFLENSPVKVKIDTQNTQSAEITGSSVNDLYVSYQQAVRAAGDGFKIDTFIASHPSSIVSAYVLYRDFSYRLSKEEIDANLSLLDTSLLDTQYVKVLNELSALLENIAIGKHAPDFALPDTEGNTVSLSDRLGKGYVLLDFWASWCGPCRRENPNIVKTYNEYKDKGFDVFSVSLDKTKDAWIKGIADDNLTWTHVSDVLFWDSAPAKLYGVRAIPANFLIDKDGIIVAKNLRGEDLGKTLAELLQ
ncbi:MAG: AhpC/TSA family protein [Tannerellaceae bacterium]|jgi:peroxiredoxin|nr:AhpC/TSA family protein [Tannerellaceae bacterium]